jgi:hypothetical protein
MVALWSDQEPWTFGRIVFLNDSKDILKKTWSLRTIAAWITPRIGGIVFRVELRDTESFCSSAMSQLKTWIRTLAAVRSLTNLMASGDEAPERET